MFDCIPIIDLMPCMAGTKRVLYFDFIAAFCQFKFFFNFCLKFPISCHIPLDDTDILLVDIVFYRLYPWFLQIISMVFNWVNEHCFPWDD